MNSQNWKIFDKHGSQLNSVADPLIKLIFNSDRGVNATGFIVTDVSGFADTSKIINSGYLYDASTIVSYSYALEENTHETGGTVSTPFYGYLYNWYAASESIAPVGCRVATNDDWDTLINYLGGPTVAASYLKQVGTSNWGSPNTDATNSTGFNALPIYPHQTVNNIWTSTDYGDFTGYLAMTSYDGTLSSPYDTGAEKNNPMSIRCIVEDPLSWTAGTTYTDYDGNVYNSVKIGTQVWLTENLCVTHYNDGTEIPYVSQSLFSTYTTPARGSYNNDNTYVFSTISSSPITYSDVSIFNPDPQNTQAIQAVSVTDISANFIYPSFSFAAAIFLKPVSKGLVETEHLFIFEETSTGYIRPYDAVNYTIVMELIGDDDEIKFFTVDENTSEVTWTDAIAFDTSVYTYDIPLQINIGFKSDV